MEEYKDRDDRCEACSAVGVQDVVVCVPVTVRPFTEVGRIKTKCLGCAVVSDRPGYCHGKKDEVCKFTISQKLRVEVPVAFGAKTEVGDTAVDCKCAENDDPCCKDKE